MRKIVLLSFVFSFLTYLTQGQDTNRVFSLKDVYGLVLSNHPVVRQADAVSSIGSLELMVSRGAFDPQLKSAYDEKTFHKLGTWQYEGEGDRKSVV